MIDYTKLKVNPDNPRFIRDDEFKKLKNSLEKFREMLIVREIAHDKDGIIWGGNQRYRALKQLVSEGLMEYKEEYFKELPEDWTLDQKKEFAIKDNNPRGISGNWDFDILANQWDDLPLEDWGINITGWVEENPSEKELWKGMPEFEPKEVNEYKQLIVHFETEEDYKKFEGLVEQKLTENTKYIWYPYKEKQDLISLEVISEK